MARLRTPSVNAIPASGPPTMTRCFQQQPDHTPRFCMLSCHHVVAILSRAVAVGEADEASGPEVLRKHAEHLVIRQLRRDRAKSLDLADIPPERLTQLLRRREADRPGH